MAIQLYYFYADSHGIDSVGGDIMAVLAPISDAWLANPVLAQLQFTPPSLVYSHATQGGQAKYLINPIIHLNGGVRLALPVASWGSTSNEGHAGLLFSDDDGRSWSPQAAGMESLVAPQSPDLEPAFAPLAGRGPNASYVALRVRGGGIYQSWSSNSSDWPHATAASLPSADSKTNVLANANGTLLLTHNIKDRRHLVVEKSVDDGRTWVTAVTLADGADGLQRCYPTTVVLPEASEESKTMYAAVYTVYPMSGARIGIGLTTFTLD